METSHKSTQNLNHKESIEKIKELLKHNNICLFTTQLSETPLKTRPMAAQEVDEEGTFWFFSGDNSNKDMEIESDSRVQLFFANTSNSEYMSVYGHAMISRDQRRIDELWNPMVKAWFKGGKDDPTLTLIRVIPDEVYYWDTKNSKMVSMLKILTSMVSGKTMDDGVEGYLKV
jgi:general stress protein 26